ELTVLPGAEVADPDEKLDAKEKAALPVLGDLLGKDLPLVDTVGGLVNELGGLTGGEALQTITIGNATCQEGGPASGDGDDKADRAPAPSVVKAALPVTG